MYTFHFAVYKRFIPDLSGFFVSVQATDEAAGGLDENRNFFLCKRSKEEVTYKKRIINGTIGEGYSVYFVPSFLEKYGT